MAMKQQIIALADNEAFRYLTEQIEKEAKDRLVTCSPENAFEISKLQAQAQLANDLRWNVSTVIEEAKAEDDEAD